MANSPPLDAATLRAMVLNLPRRIEPLGGQQFSYVQLDTVLGLIEGLAEAAAPRPVAEQTGNISQPMSVPPSPPAEPRNAIEMPYRPSTLCEVDDCPTPDLCRGIGCQAIYARKSAEAEAAAGDPDITAGVDALETLDYQARAAATGTERRCPKPHCSDNFPAMPSRWCSGCLIAALRAQVQTLTDERDALAYQTKALTERIRLETQTTTAERDFYKRAAEQLASETLGLAQLGREQGWQQATDALIAVVEQQTPHLFNGQPGSWIRFEHTLAALRAAPPPKETP